MSDEAASTGKHAPDDRGRRGANGISAFIARVLEQLSPNSWLPAVFLVGNLALLFTLEPAGWHLGVWDAITSLMKMQWGALIILLFAIVIVTIAIQAFEFELLRVLEGYWRRPAQLVRFGERRIAHHRKRREAIASEIAEAESEWIRTKLEAAVLAGEEENVKLWGMALKIARRSRIARDEVALLGKLNELRRRSAMDAETDHRLVTLNLRLEDYPEAERILPTRLGNTMRAAEDRVQLERGESLEGFMIRHLDVLPPTIADEYRVYRERLDMYCAMALVLVVLAMSAVFVLPFNLAGLGWHIAIPILYLVALWPCYNAAIASARGFGGALVEADAAVRRQREMAPSAGGIPSTRELSHPQPTRQ